MPLMVRSVKHDARQVVDEIGRGGGAAIITRYTERRWALVEQRLHQDYVLINISSRSSDPDGSNPEPVQVLDRPVVLIGNNAQAMYHLYVQRVRDDCQMILNEGQMPMTWEKFLVNSLGMKKLLEENLHQQVREDEDVTSWARRTLDSVTLKKMEA